MNSAGAWLLRNLRRLLPPPDLSPVQWAVEHRRMSSAESAFIGKFSFVLVPYFAWLLERYADPKVFKVVCRKSAQLGWTISVIGTLLGWFIHIRKTTAIVMFPKEGSARNFDREKFKPMVRSTRVLAELVPANERSADVNTLFKAFPGGFIKFVGSNSISDVKSTSATNAIVEEPDDCNLNLRGQGDSIKLLEERTKGYRGKKILIGGTPSIKGVSSIDDEYLQSDQNEWHVPCPDCGEFQALEWEQVAWQQDESRNDPALGAHLPDTARYRCAHCGSLWDDAAKNAAIARGKPVANAPFRGIVGITLNELHSAFHESRMAKLAERYIKAKRAFDEGRPEELVTFWNTALGRSWEFTSDGPTKEELETRALDYPAMTIPAGGLVLSAGCDFQHNRIAVIVRAWGRGEESWLVLWDEIYGNVLDKNDPVWTQLDTLLFGAYRHACGAQVAIGAATLDSGDGVTAELVYDYVRTRRTRGVKLMAGKGSSTPNLEIYRQPAPVDTRTTRKHGTKASRKGLMVYMVGTEKAKDTILEARLPLTGSGPGRFHWYAGVRADYLTQLQGEVKAPRRVERKAGGRLQSRVEKVWQPKAGQAVEALDGEVYALHASRALGVHLKREPQWAAIEAAMKQTAFALEAPGAAQTSAPGPAPERETVPPPPARDHFAGHNLEHWLDR